MPRSGPPLDRLAARAGLSASGLAKKAGLDPTTFNKSKRITPDGRAALALDRIRRQVAGRDRHPIETFVALIRRRRAPVTQSVPLIGLAEAGAAAISTTAAFRSARAGTRSPFPAVNDEHAYALEISGNSMEPAYRKGDVIVVSPAAPIRRGDRVVVKTKEGEVMVKQLARKTAKTIELHSLNADHPDRTLPMSDVLWVARIVWASQ